MLRLLELVVLLVAVMAASHWGTFGFANQIDGDEWQKFGAGTPAVAAVLAIYLAWCKARSKAG